MAAFISLYVMQVSHAAVQQGQMRGRPGGLLLEALIALPDLAGISGLSNRWCIFPCNVCFQQDITFYTNCTVHNGIACARS